MRKLVSSQAALEADRAAEQLFGYPPELLMEEAGIRLQDALERLEETGAWPRGRVVYLVGPGNNGGDGWVMARQAFLRGRTDLVVAAVRPSSSTTVLQAERARAVGLRIVDWPSADAERELEKAVVWVDALWGTGLSTPLRPERLEALMRLESLRLESRKPTVAVDVPSGLFHDRGPNDPVLLATWTLSAGPAKDFCYFPEHRGLAGRLVEVPIAFPQPATARGHLLEDSDLPNLLPAIAPHDHKGRRGHVGVLGGAPGMSGALVLAARSAAAAGAGLVSLGVDPELVAIVAPQVPAFQTRLSVELTTSDRIHALVVGPGWGRGAERAVMLQQLWNTPLPLVVDADALGAWVELGRPSRAAPTVFTPHPGEFLRLGAGPATVDAAAQMAASASIVVVLKGATTWILAPDGRRTAWDGGEPALGTGGSGDCLAGVVGALLAVGASAFDAACGAVALHGAAGRALARAEGWFTADRLPEALARTALACRSAARPL